MPGTLFVVATPIGNLQDITSRTAEAFATADFIAAEDTRVTLRLLNHLNIKKPLISYHEHNARQQSDVIISRLLDGESAALCSDAGTPAISDPGETLVKKAHQHHLKVVPIPGASAVVAALSVSGQDTARFVFEGFLPAKRSERDTALSALADETRTLVFYEAPHKLAGTLTAMEKHFGGERSLTICRELTKKYEEINKTTLQEAALYYTENTPRGEFVLVVAGASPAEEQTLTLDEAAALGLQQVAQNGLSFSHAAKQTAQATGHPRSEIYRKMLQSRDNA